MLEDEIAEDIEILLEEGSFVVNSVFSRMVNNPPFPQITTTEETK